MVKFNIDDVISINAEYEGGNLTIEKFARLKGLKKSTVAWIRKRARRHLESQADKRPNVSFTKVQPLVSQPVQVQEIRLEVCGVNIFVADDFNAGALAKIVTVLQND